MKSDYEKTGNLYDKLDAYAILRREESRGVKVYAGSSCQFKTAKAYKTWLEIGWPGLVFVVEKSQ